MRRTRGSWGVHQIHPDERGFLLHQRYLCCWAEPASLCTRWLPFFQASGCLVIFILVIALINRVWGISHLNLWVETRHVAASITASFVKCLEEILPIFLSVGHQTCSTPSDLTLFVLPQLPKRSQRQSWAAGLGAGGRKGTAVWDVSSEANCLSLNPKPAAHQLCDMDMISPFYALVSSKKNGDDTDFSLIVLLWGLDEVPYAKCSEWSLEQSKCSLILFIITYANTCIPKLIFLTPIVSLAIQFWP